MNLWSGKIGDPSVWTSTIACFCSEFEESLDSRFGNCWTFDSYGTGSQEAVTTTRSQSTSAYFGKCTLQFAPITDNCWKQSMSFQRMKSTLTATAQFLKTEPELPHFIPAWPTFSFCKHLTVRCHGIQYNFIELCDLVHRSHSYTVQSGCGILSELHFRKWIQNRNIPLQNAIISVGRGHLNRNGPRDNCGNVLCKTLIFYFLFKIKAKIYIHMPSSEIYNEKLTLNLCHLKATHGKRGFTLQRLRVRKPRDRGIRPSIHLSGAKYGFMVKPMKWFFLS